MTVSRTLVLIALAGIAAAADDSLTDYRAVNDLRLIGLSSGKYEGGDGADLKTDRGAHIGVGFFRSFVDEFEGDVTGILLGAEGSRGRATGTGVTIEDIALTIHAGFAYQTDFRPVHVELDPFLGIGRARVVDNAFGTDHSTYWDVGLRFAVFYTFDIGLQLGLDVRWESENARIHVANHLERLATHGLAGGGSVGWRF